MSGLTTYEILKVVGKTLESFAAAAEVWEAANPGKPYKPDTGSIVSMVVNLLKDLGVEATD